MSTKAVFEIEGVTAKKDTKDALCVIINDEPYWVPKSAIDDDSEVYAVGHSGKFVVAQWWAENKGLV